MKAEAFKEWLRAGAPLDEEKQLFSLSGDAWFPVDDNDVKNAEFVDLPKMDDGDIVQPTPVPSGRVTAHKTTTSFPQLDIKEVGEGELETLKEAISRGDVAVEAVQTGQDEKRYLVRWHRRLRFTAER